MEGGSGAGNFLGCDLHFIGLDGSTIIVDWLPREIDSAVRCPVLVKLRWAHVSWAWLLCELCFGARKFVAAAHIPRADTELIHNTGLKTSLSVGQLVRVSHRQLLLLCALLTPEELVITSFALALLPLGDNRARMIFHESWLIHAIRKANYFHDIALF